MAIIENLKRLLSARLNREVENYAMRMPNNMSQLFVRIRPGDVILVEGKQRISRAIKFFTNSVWSHVALYVGAALLNSPRVDAGSIRQKFGEEGERLLVEALPGVGVVANPLAKYETHNLRVCRPSKIHFDDLKIVIDTVIADLGKSYDERNIIDLAIQLLPLEVWPLRKKHVSRCIGECNEFQVTCSGHIARAFQKVNYPILLAAPAHEQAQRSDQQISCAVTSDMRHYSQIVPQDFDLSPNFEIINFNLEAGDAFSLPVSEEHKSQTLGTSRALGKTFTHNGDEHATCAW